MRCRDCKVMLSTFPHVHTQGQFKSPAAWDRRARCMWVHATRAPAAGPLDDIFRWLSGFLIKPNIEAFPSTCSMGRACSMCVAACHTCPSCCAPGNSIPCSGHQLCPLHAHAVLLVPLLPPPCMHR